MKKYKTLIITTILCLLPILLALVVYDRLPAQIAIHFDSAGNPDNYLPRALAAFGLPVLLALINLYIHFRLNTDPKITNASSVLRSLNRWALPFISVIIMPVTLFMAMDVDIPINIVATAIAGVMIVIYGNYLPKCKYNYTIGIRLPWTLHNEDNWNRTNRFAGFIWVTGGLLFIANAFLSLWYVTALIFILLLVAPVVYSYLTYRKQTGNGTSPLTS
jgi:uncharacterized membrane protein